MMCSKDTLTRCGMSSAEMPDLVLLRSLRPLTFLFQRLVKLCQKLYSRRSVNQRFDILTTKTFWFLNMWNPKSLRDREKQVQSMEIQTRDKKTVFILLLFARKQLEVTNIWIEYIYLAFSSRQINCF